MNAKEQIRAQMHNMRKGCKQDEGSIINNLCDIIATMPHKSLGLYYPMADEIDVRSLFKKFDNLSLPIFHQNVFYFGKFDMLCDMVKNHWGFTEPKDFFCVNPEVIVVPGLAFDLCGSRLGRGKGHYDQYLSTHKDIVSVGICFEYQIVETLPQEEHDQKINYLIRYK